MSSFDGSSDDSFFDNGNLLQPEEALDEDEVGEDLDEGYSPLERPLGLSAWGLTDREGLTHESLARRLAHEQAEVAAPNAGDELGDASDTDGELIDDQVGDARSGRLVLGEIDAADSRSDFWARDVGVDGAGASAEEAAIHIVPEAE